MNEATVLNETTEILKGISNLLDNTNDALDDVKSVVAACETSQGRIAAKAIDQLQEDITDGQLKVVQTYIENGEDDRSEYLDNLRGYFNEETGTWYDQICENFKKLTGFKANKWDALTWTIDISQGHSTFDHLVHHGTIKQKTNGGWETYLPLDDLGRFGNDIGRIKHHLDTNFQELK